MVNDLERFRGAMDKTKQAAQTLVVGQEEMVGLGEVVSDKDRRIELIEAMQAELGHSFIVWLFTDEAVKETSIKIKRF